MTNPPFWQTKHLREMSEDEWESLCDGCGKCCLVKLEDIDTGNVFYSNIACKLIDADTCQCSNYPQRRELVSDCVRLQPEDIDEFHWLPSTCAYRLLAENKPLEWWHPLVSGDRNSVHKAEMSIKDKYISEQNVHPDDLQEHIITWVD